MKKRKPYIVWCIIMVLLLVAITAVIRWKKDENLRFAKQLGVGINMGNSLDATGLREYHPEAGDLEYEVFWNNPAITREQLRTIRQAGFQTVRIPVSWSEHMDEEGRVSDIWMNRVQEVVDMALKEELYVILNAHHENFMDLVPGNEALIEEKLCGLWSQIADRFAQYDERLIFEGMNEPRQKDSEYEWNEGTKELRSMVNDLNLAFVKTVRESGNLNKDRYLMITTYAGHNLETVMDELEIPKGHIMVSIHAYLPYVFCQKRDGSSEWDSRDPQDTEEIKRALSQMNQRFIQNGVPVVLTEFGCVDKDNPDDRKAWLQYFMTMAKENGIRCIWWDNGSSFQLLDREQNSWKYPQLVECLTSEEFQ